MDINWLMGFIEAKGCFTISQQKIKVGKKKYTQGYIISLDKKKLIREIRRLFKREGFFPKKKTKFFLNIVRELLIIHSFSEKELSKRSMDELRELLLLISTLKSVGTEDFRYFHRPAFSLTFNQSDKQLTEKIIKFIKRHGIKIYGPYEMNVGENVRLEIKGVENCLKFYDLLANQKWYTSKQKSFEEWGKKMFELSNNRNKK